jgi:imidazolonepropionase-like amidohydrolase
MTTFAFEDVNVADMAEGRTVPNRTVLVRDRRITAVGPADEVEVPADALRVPSRGKTLLPGLCDMHVHIAPHAAGPGFDEAEAFRRAGQYLLVFLASGVTTVRNMAGTPLHLALREAVADGRIEGPRIFSCGPILETRFTFPEIAEFGTLVETAEQGRAAVRAQKAAGFDYIKVYNDIEAEIYDAIIETAREVGIPVVGHVAFQKGLDGALKARQDSIEHLRSYDCAADTRPAGVPRARYEGWLYTTPQRIRELAERTAEAGVWNAPTMVVERGIRTDAEMQTPLEPLPGFLPGWLSAELDGDGLETLFSSQQREALAKGRGARAEMVVALDKVGAGLLAGSDCPGCRLVPGRSLIRELELMVESGLSAWRALRTATTEAARFLGLNGEGLIRSGARADLLLVEGDPLADISALRRQAGVVVNGRWLPSADIERMLVNG